VHGLILSAALQISVLAGGSTADAAVPYKVARQVLQQTGKPMLVMVSAEWCPACRQMKSSVIPQVQRRAVFRQVVFTVVDFDEQPDLARALTGGGPIPQLVLYRKSGQGWLRRRLVGGQSAESVERMIREALAAQQSESREQQSQGRQTAEAQPGNSRSPAPSAAARTPAQRTSTATAPSRTADQR